MLSITCDNASNNDKMIEHLSTLIKSFPGAANQTRCFTHILNLLAKSILCQFDVPKKKEGEEDLDDATNALEALGQELEIASDNLNNDEESDADEDDVDDENGLGGDRDGMSEEEMAELEESLTPIRLMLTKVRGFKLSILPKLIFHSFMQLPTRLRTLPPSSSLNGSPNLRNSS